MLHRSFKPAKCKTALNLAKSRIKLLKNKKEIQVKQLRRELAQLLESGQYRTALIRVEHVVREEKTMAAYEMIEIYCELIVARLPIIESQKNCPLDLKEAIASLIFAAPRCGDIPELQDVRKHFTAKYGKDFVAAAIELRPACGVSRTMVEKLSVKAPDGPTKVKILTAIAEEHNFKWEPNWFKDEEVHSPDIPKGQLSEKANIIQMEPLNFEISDDIQKRNANDVARSATSSHIDTSAVSQSVSSRTNTGLGSSLERLPFNRSTETAENSLSTSRHNWNMEFKDATAAAQAAAESAERASMAARAAAELSTRDKFVSDVSAEPEISSLHDQSEGSGVSAGSVLQQGYMESNPKSSSFNRGSSYKQRPEGDDTRESRTSSYPVQEMSRQPGDSLSVPDTHQDESNVFQSLTREEYEKQPSENPFHEESAEMKNHPSSFQFQSSTFGDEYDIFSHVNNQNKINWDDGSFGNFNQGAAIYDDRCTKTGFYDANDEMDIRDHGERSTFLGSDEPKHVFRSKEDIFDRVNYKSNEIDVGENGTHTDTGVVFDESGSDDDEDVADHGQRSYDLPSHGKSSYQISLFHDKTSENQGRQSSSSRHPPYGLDVSESFRESPLYSELSKPVPITFDSDGEHSGSEKELQNGKSEPRMDRVSDTEPQNMELNFGRLPVGLRNKPLRHLPYTQDALDDNSTSLRSVTDARDDAFDPNQHTSVFKVQASFNNSDHTQSPTVASSVHSPFLSTSDDPDMGTIHNASNTTERPFSGKFVENIHKSSVSPKSQKWFFDSDDSSSDDAPKQSVTRKTPSGVGLSHRTKASSRRSVAKSPQSAATNNISETGHSSSPYAKGASPNSRSTNANLRWDNEETSQPRPQRRVLKIKEDENLSSPVAEELVTPSKKVAEISKASSSNEKAPSRENSTKNPSHVHPKLPDFESLAARLQSLRTNQQ